MRSLSFLLFGLCAAGLLTLGSSGSTAQEGKAGGKVKVGDKAPSFTSVDESGKTWKSADHVGKKVVVLYFYPADFTGGCTSQACGYRDEIEKAGSKDVEIVGVSGDSPKTHAMFKTHHKLPFTLLADEKGDVAKLFGVPAGKGGESPTIDAEGQKGKAPRGVTIQRWTVVIDKAGTVAAIDQIKAAGDDAKRVAQIVKNLESK
jgi:thioredoxin-dependent peroxiredoxin